MATFFRIYDLTTEYAVNPINLFTQKPRFSWKYDAYDGFCQKSYRIAVSSTREKLLANEYDLWDSGVVESRQNVAIEYAGKELFSRSEGFWKCIIEDVKGAKAESEIATFEIALLQASDWHGQWQAAPLNFHGIAQYWRAPITIENKAIRRARAYVCGLGYHEFFVNGKKIGDAVLNPGTTDYSKRVLYCTYDITNELQGGENCFGFILGYGWFGCRKLLVQVYIDYKDGTESEFYTMHHAGIWRVGEGPVRENSIYHGERYDSRLEKDIVGWCEVGYHADYDNGWVFSITTDAPAGKLVSQTIEPIKVVADYPAQLIHEEENRKIFALSANIAGWMKFAVKGECGAKVIIRHAEKLTADKKGIETVNLRTAKATDEYILKGEGVEEYEPRFTYHGFQYAEFTVEGNAELLWTVGRFVRTSVDQKSSFLSSDDVLNKLHANAVTTEAANLHSILTDCPQRDERFGWLNDVTARVYQEINNFNMARLYPKVLWDMADTQREDGAIADTAPHGIGQRPADPICASFFLLGLHSYRYYGDKKILKEMYPHYQGWFDYLTSRSKDYLLEYSYYGDWVMPYPPEEESTPENAKTPGHYMSAAYYYWHAKMLEEMADILGKDKEKENYSICAENIKQAFQKRYFDKETCNYCTGSQTANSVALSLDLCPAEYRGAVAKNVADNIVAMEYHNTTGNQGYRHLFYALSDEGYADLLYKMIVNPTYPGWGYMIDCGAVSVWERWESEAKIEMNSFNHPMFGSYDGWFFHKIAGLELGKGAVAANTMRIIPMLLKDVSFVTAEIETINGKATSSWKKVNDGVEYEFTLPYNVDSEIVLTGSEYEIISGSIQDEKTKNGKVFLKMLGGKMKIKVKN